MVVNPNDAMGVAPPQGLSNTQMNMPPQAGPPAPVDPATGMPMDPMAAMMPPQEPPPPPKPPSMIPTDIAVLLADALNKTKLEAAKGLAGHLGDPRGTVNAKDADLVRVWRKMNPSVDPLYEKLVNKKSDEEIMQAMYPGRRALIRVGRRTYTEQVAFAEHMAKLNADPRFDDLDNVEDEDSEDQYVPPQSDFPSVGEENYEDEVRLPEDQED